MAGQQQAYFMTNFKIIKAAIQQTTAYWSNQSGSRDQLVERRQRLVISVKSFTDKAHCLDFLYVLIMPLTMICLSSPWPHMFFLSYISSISFLTNPFSSNNSPLPYSIIKLRSKHHQKSNKSSLLKHKLQYLTMFPCQEFGFSYFDHLQPQTSLKELNERIFSQQSEQSSQSKKISWLVPPKKIQKHFWKQHENLLYLQFLELHESEYYQCFAFGTTSPMNAKMSSFVKSRTAKQCRSHHQKMIKKYHSVEEIITHLRFMLKKRQNSSEALCHNRLTFQLDYSLQEKQQFYHLLSPEPLSHSFVDLNAFIQ